MALLKGYPGFFKYKKEDIGKNPCPGPKDITCRDTFGTSPTGAIKRSFCSNFRKIGEDTFSGYTRQESDMG